MNIFLRAKHWQLFLATFGMPILIEIIILSFFFNPASGRNPIIIVSYFRSFPPPMLLLGGILFGWQWAVATGFQKMIPPCAKMKVKRFKIFFFIAANYLVLICTLMLVDFGDYNLNNYPLDSAFIIGFLLIFATHLFAMFCIFYNLYFLAKTLKTAELQRPVTFRDFIGEFFLAWFFPIGIWILQPRINRVVAYYSCPGRDNRM
jgi:hypothetical protein